MNRELIHPTAVVSKHAKLGKDVSIGAYSIVESGAVLGDGVILHSHTHICGTTILGANCEVFSFAALGHSPQDVTYSGEQTRLIIGDNTVIREHVTMHCGSKNGRMETKVGARGYFMAGSHIAHDCIVGDDVIVTNNTCIGGHAVIGNGCNLGAIAAIHQFCHIGDHAFIGAMAIVTRDVIPYAIALGNHAHLAGLNIVGLKRHQFSRSKIHIMRSAYRILFANDGIFEQRIEKVKEEFSSHSEVIQIIDFIQSNRRRPLCFPHAK